MKSSYFPQTNEESDIVSETSYIRKICPPQIPSYPSNGIPPSHPGVYNEPSVVLPVHNHNDGLLHFPSSAHILWDRTTLAPPVYISPSDVLPNLILNGREVRKLVSLLDQNYDLPAESMADTFNANAYVYHQTTLPPSHQALVQLLSRGIIQDRSDYYMSFDRHQIQDLQLTIPISRSTNGHRTSMHILQDNLWKSVTSCKDFAIKHFMRIRAHGHLQPFQQNNNNNNMQGKLRFEALLPEVNLQILPIHPLPILSTALASTLFDTNSNNNNKSNNRNSNQRSPSHRVDARIATLEASNMGYVTLNQTRKVVFLAESDSSLTSTPIVGVWVRLAADSYHQHLAQYEYDWAKLVKHPYCWTACVRFLYHQKVLQRHFVAQDTFLLTLLVGESAYFCEVTAHTNANSGSGYYEETQTSRPLSFLHLDFTASLSAENDIDLGRNDDQVGGVICRFKPVQSPIQRSRPFYHHTNNIDNRDNNGSNDDNETPQMSPKRFNLLSPHHNTTSSTLPQETSSSSFVSQTNSILPPNTPQATNTSWKMPPGTFSALQTARKNEELSQQQQQHNDNDRASNAPNHHTVGTLPIDYLHQPKKASMQLKNATFTNGSHHYVDLAYQFPAEIIAAQQQQIAMLQSEVSSLKEMARMLMLQSAAATAANANANINNDTNTYTNTYTNTNKHIAGDNNSSSTKDEVSELFDSFQRQVINVLRSSHTSLETPSQTGADCAKDATTATGTTGNGGGLIVLDSEPASMLSYTNTITAASANKDTAAATTVEGNSCARKRSVHRYAQNEENSTVSVSGTSAGSSSLLQRNPQNNQNDLWYEQNKRLPTDKETRYDEDEDFDEADDEEDAVVSTTNNRDYDEGEVQFYVRKNNFRPLVVSTVPSANTSANTNNAKSSSSSSSTSATPKKDVNSVLLLPKKKSIVTPATSTSNNNNNSNNRSSEKGKKDKKTIVKEDVARYESTNQDEETYEEFADNNDYNHDNDDYFAKEESIIVNTPPRKSINSATHNSGLKPSKQWLEEAEKSMLRESESILAIESKYR